MYAVRFQVHEALGLDGEVLAQDGQWFWIVMKDYGLTSEPVVDENVPPVDAFRVKTMMDGMAIAPRWERTFHPWYTHPNGSYAYTRIKD